MGELQSHRGEHSNRGAEGKAERFLHRGSVPTSIHQPERLVCSPAGRDRWGLWAEALAWEVRSQGEDWGWLCEHSLKGISVPQLAGRESGKKIWSCRRGKRQLFQSAWEEGIQSTAKRAPEMGTSFSYQHRHQGQAWNAKATAADTKKPVCKHRSLSTPPLPGACAARHCQGPVIQGQHPRESTWCAPGWCNITLASATAG